jgi:hypothetical protein
MNMTNDAEEGHWSYHAFERGATRVLREELHKKKGFEGLNKGFLDRMDAIISSLPLVAHPFIACFSRDPDILSQWRAYAADGTGFALLTR